MNSKWIKPSLVLLVVGLLASFAPTTALDPWNVLNLKKLFVMIFTLVFIQTLGQVLIPLLGTRAGSIITGFGGGLISSTATIVSLARRSKTRNSAQGTGDILTFLSATVAMLVEGVALLIAGLNDVHFPLLALFTGPILTSMGLILFSSRKFSNQHFKESNKPTFELLPTIKLTAFIILILFISKLLQHFLGQSGILLFTFAVSLFEIHGSVIANVQLHDNGTINVQLLCNLLTLSILASYLSKLCLVYILGEQALKRACLKSSFFLVITTALMWWISKRYLLNLSVA